MRKHQLTIQFTTIFLVFICFLGVFFLRKTKIKSNSPATTVLDYFHYVPPHIAQMFTFGFKNVLSDIIWIVTIQKSVFAEGKTEQSYLELFNLANLTIALDPKIELAYRYISQILLMEGKPEYAEKLFTKFLSSEIVSWRMYMLLAWYYGEIKKDRKKAIDYYYKSSKIEGSPPYFKSLVAKLAVNNSDLSDFNVTKMIVEEMLMLAKDEETKKRIIQHYEKLINQARNP